MIFYCWNNIYYFQTTVDTLWEMSKDMYVTCKMLNIYLSSKRL